MLTKQEIVHKLIPHLSDYSPQKKGSAFAPSNIALVKYWGKRNEEINLPMTSSLSISLGDKGSSTTVQVNSLDVDEFFLNNTPLALNTPFSQKILAYLNLFRPDRSVTFRVETHSNLPISAGLASSASGFAALILALNQLFQWQLSPPSLSILARLGSGSACRSIWPGFVEWQSGEHNLGMDSHGYPISTCWDDLSIGLVIISDQEKLLSSRKGMSQTMKTSILYQAWPHQVTHDLRQVKTAIAEKNMELLGASAENNALSMHATMLASRPPVVYWHPETLAIMHKIWQLRAEGLPLYFTEDAGPNLKLLFLKKNEAEVKQFFPEIAIIHPFET